MRDDHSLLTHALRPAPDTLEVPAVSADAPGEERPAFSAELTRWRERRGLPKKKLAAAMGFDASYLSHVEAGRMHASGLFARKAEEALDAGGELAAAWRRDNGGSDGAGPRSQGGLSSATTTRASPTTARPTVPASGGSCSTAARSRSPGT